MIDVLIVWSHLRASFGDPGYSQGYKGIKCSLCSAFKQDFTTHHCSKCERCVTMMDHHCFWTNNCVAQKSFKPFI